MSLGTPASLTSLPLETGFNIFGQGLSIKNLRDLRETSKDLRLEVDEFVKNLLIRSNTQGPFILKNFLATQKEPITSTNAWSILGLFKKAYPSFPLDVSIEKGCQQLDQATMALKEALVLQNPQQFANLALQQTAEEIRSWFANTVNQPLLEGVQELNLSGRGIFLIPLELRFFPNVQLLFLEQNKISSIDAEAFCNLQKLQWVGLHNNQIKTIPTNAFSNLPNLYRVCLRQNQIKTIATHAFVNLQNLAEIELQENQIKTIPTNAYSNLPNLKCVYLI